MDATKTTNKPQFGTAYPAETKTAKLFMNGRSQAVRLPKEFRFEGVEVLIRRDPATGEVLLSPKVASPQSSWHDLFDVWDALGSPEEDVLERNQTPPTERDFL